MTQSNLQTRILRLDRAALAGDAIPVTVSSITPVDRGGWIEVLDHSPHAIDLTRAVEGLPLIEGHDLSRAPLGRIVDLKTDGKRLRGTVKFGASTRAQEILADVRAGIVTGLSIGYQVLATKTDGETVTATLWQPHEASAVAVPADMAAGFFRNLPLGDNTMTTEIDTDVESVQLSRSQRRAAASSLVNDQERIGSIRDILSRFSKFADEGAHQLAQRLIDTGGTFHELQGYILARVNDKPAPSSNIGFSDTRSLGGGELGLSRKDLASYSLIRAIRASAYGKDQRRLIEEAGLEMEISAALAQRSGITPKGIAIPNEVFFGRRDLMVGTSTAGGHLVATELLAGSYISTLDVMPQVIALGATTLPNLTGNVAIPRMTSGTAPAWLASEGATFTETQPAFDQVTLTPKDIATMTDLSRRLLQQSTPAADQLVRSDLARRISAGIDRAAVAGTGTSGQPLGILGTAGIGSVAGGTNGLAPNWNNVTKLIQEVGIDNALTGKLGFLTNASVAATLLRTEKAASTGMFIWEAGRDGSEGTVAGYRAAVSNNVPSNLTKGTASGICSAMIFGNWSDLLIGMWGGIDLTIDPYTFSSSGALRITAAATVDIAVRHPESFAAIQDVLTT